MKITINESTVKCVPFAARIFLNNVISKIEDSQNIKISKDEYSKIYNVEINEDMVGDIISVFFTGSIFLAASTVISMFTAGNAFHDFGEIAKKYGFVKTESNANNVNNTTINKSEN